MSDGSSGRHSIDRSIDVAISFYADTSRGYDCEWLQTNIGYSVSRGQRSPHSLSGHWMDAREKGKNRSHRNYTLIMRGSELSPMCMHMSLSLTHTHGIIHLHTSPNVIFICLRSLIYISMCVCLSLCTVYFFFYSPLDSAFFSQQRRIFLCGIYSLSSLHWY